MKAAVYRKYGSPDVIELTRFARPVPKENEVLIRVRATTVSSADWRARSLEMPAGFGVFGRLAFGIGGPRQPILGTELAGEVVAVGKAVKAFAVGDEVIAASGAKLGCHAEYKCMAEDAPIVRKPANLSWEEAAALSFGGNTALHFLRVGELKRGEKLLVNGASGCVGSAAVQLAKHLGAEVTGVCSGANVELVRSLGADHVIDYTRDDFTAGGGSWDVILDTAGTAPFSRCRGSLARGGRLLRVLGTFGDLFRAPWVALTTDKKFVAGPASESRSNLIELAELAAAGAFRPVIDRCYPFEQIADAHRLVDTGRKKGSVVITLAA